MGACPHEQVLFSILLCNAAVPVSDAIILLEGDGWSRVKMAADLYKEGLAPTVVPSGGVDGPEMGNMHSRLLKERLIKLGVPAEHIMLEEKSMNTREQAQEIMRLGEEQGWKRIILVASHYHIFRAFLTFLKMRQEKHSSVDIFCAPVRDLPWFREERGKTRTQLLETEFEKIEKYKEHVATFTDALRYIEKREHATM